MSGPPAGTPVGQCVEQAVIPAAAATRPFEDSAGGSVSVRRTFPLDPAESK